MAGYRKKIAYLDYLENGMKMKNAGFVRLEESNGQVRLEMRVKNIPESFGGQYELKADVGGVVGRISLLRGSGSCCMVWKTGSRAADGKRFVRAGGVYVRLPGRHLLQAVWEEPMELCVEADGSETDSYKTDDGETGGGEKDGGRTEHGYAGIDMQYSGGAKNMWKSDSTENCRKPAAETAAIKTAAENAELWQEGRLAAKKEELQREGQFAAEKTEPQRDESWASEKEKPQQEERRAAEEPVCYGDKWEQLTHMYAVIHPFGDGREYLSIAPKDFIVLRSEYQKMVHNSFLLHGYYNYRHLILGKVRENGEWRYYLGVPGNFYGREKMVAEMFGFEAFEGEKEPAKAGDFGYFMKRVEI